MGQNTELARHAFIYGGSLLLPRLSAFAALIIFSRLLSPAEYGYFALFIISSEFIDAVFFNWIRVAFLRLFPEAKIKGALTRLRRTSFAMLGIAVLLSVPVAVLMAALVAGEDWFVFATLLVLAGLANALFRTRLADLQAQQRPSQHFAIGLARACLTLMVSVLLVLTIGPSAQMLISGFVIASLVLAVFCSLVYLPDLISLQIDRSDAKSIISYAGPIVPLTAMTASIPFLQRYVIQLAIGPAAVGVFSAAQNLVQPPIFMLAAAVATASFPQIMQTAETEGLEAAARRIREAGRYLVALGLPALAGIVLLRNEVVTVFLGQEFREGAADIIPWVAAAALASNLKSHYFDAAFHVTRQLSVQLLMFVPVVILMAPLVYLFLNIWGLPGAAAAACLVYVLSMVGSFVVGRRFLHVAHDFGEFGRVLLAVVVMSVVLVAMPPLDGALGLGAQIGAGLFAYAVAAVALNILGIRSILYERLAGRPKDISISG